MDAGYHHQQSKGRKSPAPIDGQGALNNSIPINDKSTGRIGISSGQFVVLKKTSEGLFHGHIRPWDELEDQMKNALRDNGLVNSKGKILNKS